MPSRSLEQLSIVMPAYNEEGCIQEVVSAWLTVLEEVPGTLIVVNDGSRDRTGEILDELSKRHANLRVINQKNGGHGNAVLNGYREAIQLGAEWVFQTDSDDQFDRTDFWKLWDNREKSSFQLGIRAERHDPFVRILISRLNAALLSILFGTVIRDANVPFRLIRRGLLSDLLALLPPAPFAPNIFLSVLAKRGGVQLIEAPVTHRERRTGTVSILRWKLWQVCWRCVRELWGFRAHLKARREEVNRLAAWNPSLSETRESA